VIKHLGYNNMVIVILAHYSNQVPLMGYAKNDKTDTGKAVT